MNNANSKRDWFGRGNFEYSRSGSSFYISRSEAGYIYNNCFNWTDYKFSFDFKIDNQYLGWIIRARDLSNCIMLQCDAHGINPHYRINSRWFRKEKEDFGLIFNKPMSIGKWCRAEIFCTRDLVDIKIIDENMNIFFEKSWEIPKTVPCYILDREGKIKQVDIDIFALDFGTIGFRAAPSGDTTESGYIKNILVEKM